MSSGPVEQFRPMTSTFSALERREHRLDVGAQQHLAALGSSETEHWIGSARPVELERLARAEHRGLDLEDVLRRLDDYEVGAALD